MATGSVDATVKIWDSATGTEQQTLSGFDSSVLATTFNKDGSKLFAGSESGMTIAWNVPATANNFDPLKMDYTLQTEGGGNLAISPDGSRLAVASCFNLMIYDIHAASAVSEPVLLFNTFAHGNCINGVLFDNSGNWIYTASADGTVKEWEVATGQQLFYLSGNILGIGSIAINPAGTHLLAANYGGSLNTWEIEPGGNEEWFSIYGSESTGFMTADGSMFITDIPVSETESRVDFWKFTPAGLEKAFPEDLVLSYSGYYAASSNPARLVVLREDETTRQIFAEIWDPATGKMWKHFPVFSSTSTSGPLCQPGEDCLTIQSCSADGTQFTIVSDSGIVYQWDIEAEKMVQEYAGPKSRWMWSFFSPDGSMLSTAGSDDPVAKVWDTRTGKLIMEFAGHTGSVFEGRFSQDGRRLITGSSDRIARVWDIQTGKLILALPQHTAIVHNAIFSPDGKYLATVGHDRSAKLWDAASGKELLSFNGTFVFFSPDSKHLIITDLDGIVRGYYLDEGELMKKARSLLIRTWTEEECSNFLHASTCPAAP